LSTVGRSAAEQLDHETAEEAEIEHGLAREGITKLNELVSAPGFGAAVEMLKGGIGHRDGGRARSPLGARFEGRTARSSARCGHRGSIVDEQGGTARRRARLGERLITA